MFSPWNGVWWKNSEINAEPNCILCQCSSVRGGIQTLVSTFQCFCACLVGNTMRICTLHSFGICRCLGKSSICLHCWCPSFFLGILCTSLQEVFGCLDNVWFPSIYARGDFNTLLFCGFLFGLSCIGGEKSSSCHLFVFNCSFSFYLLVTELKAPRAVY